MNKKKQFSPVRDAVAKRMHGGKLMSSYVDNWQMQMTEQYILGVAKSEGLSVEEAREFIFRDEKGEAYKGYAVILEIADLRRQGKYKDADDLIRKHRGAAKAEAKRVRNAERQAKRDARMQRRKRRKPRKS